MSNDGSKSSLTVIQNGNIVFSRVKSVKCNFYPKMVAKSALIPQFCGMKENGKLFAHAPLKERVVKQKPATEFSFLKSNQHKSKYSPNSSSDSSVDAIESAFSSHQSNKRSFAPTTSSPRLNKFNRMRFLIKEAQLSPIRSPKRALSQYYKKENLPEAKKFRLATSIEENKGVIVKSEQTIDTDVSVEKDMDDVDQTMNRAKHIIDHDTLRMNNCPTSHSDVSSTSIPDTVQCNKGAMWHLISDSNITPQFKMEARTDSEQCIVNADILNKSDHVEMTPTKSLSEADQHSFHLTSPPAICSHLPSHILHRKLTKKSAFAKLKFASQQSTTKPLIRSLLVKGTSHQTRYASDSTRLATEVARRTALSLSESQSVAKLSMQSNSYSSQHIATNHSIRPLMKQKLASHSQPQFKVVNTPSTTSPPPLIAKENTARLHSYSSDKVLDTANNKAWRGYALSQNSSFIQMVEDARDFLETQQFDFD